ncbi:hypothetical protein BKA63DRAFT_559619 [Paraphoma chrysanthemicola]|nr:hypothetical protein BKA63DRAFT_559619 [Paraphoma chrysanthemicola]
MSADQPGDAAVAPSVVAAVKGELIAIHIGPTRGPFHVHAALLTHHSEYFRIALRGLWKDAQERVIAIEDIEPATFGFFVRWLYTQGVPNHAMNVDRPVIVDCDVPSGPDAPCEILHNLLEAYVFGDRFLVPQYRHEANKQFSAVLTRHGAFGTKRWQINQYAFTHISSERPILQHIVDDHCRDWSPDDDVKEDLAAQQNLPYKFLLRVMKRQSTRLQTIRMQDILQDGLRCYIEHDSDKERKECGQMHLYYYDEEDIPWFA